MRRLGSVALIAAALLVPTACSGDSGQAPVVTEMVYVDAQGNTVAPPAGAPDGVQSAGESATTTVTESATATIAEPTVPMEFFKTPDGQIWCGTEPSGGFGNQDARPDFACVSTQASIPRPEMSNCSPNIGRWGGAGALGPGWVATGVCTGGWFFMKDSSQIAAAQVGQRVASGPVTCTVEAADAVQCTLGAEGFRLSSTAISAWGNDVTES